MALIVGGYVLISDELTARTEAEYKNIALVIAETSIIAELYRNDSDLFLRVRDSIFKRRNITISELNAFKEKMKDNHQDWEVIWDYVSFYTDSLVNDRQNNIRTNLSNTTDSTDIPILK